MSALQQMMLSGFRYTIENLDGIQLIDTVIARQAVDSSTQGFQVSANGAFLSRVASSAVTNVAIVSLDTGRWRDTSHPETGFYQMRFSLDSGNKNSFACLAGGPYGTYPMSAAFGVNWFDPNAMDAQIYTHIAHTPPPTWNEILRIEVRYTSNLVPISSTTISLAPFA